MLSSTSGKMVQSGQNRSFFARAHGHAPLKRDRDGATGGPGHRDGPGLGRDTGPGHGTGPPGPPESATSGGGLRARDFLVSQEAV